MPVKKLLNKLNGLQYPQEYLCIDKETFSNPLHVYIVKAFHAVKDITNQHLFLGYSPLVFAIPAEPGEEFAEQIRLIFSNENYEPGNKILVKDIIAALDLKIIKKGDAGNKTIFYYEGLKGIHFFLSPFHRFINNLNNQLFNKRPGNVFLNNNLYKQVQIAYSIPRIISTITVSEEELFNLFPTDLHGSAGIEHYLISLRVGGSACEQVIRAGKLLLAGVEPLACKTVYALGKNHMMALRPEENFPFSQSLSPNLHLPLPEFAVRYKELLMVDSFTKGIHHIMLFKTIHEKTLQSEPGTLAHIHNSYASWRFKKNLQSNYLLF